MKKTVLLILAALMCVTLISCGGNQSGTIETTVKEITPEGNLILDADIGDLEGEAIIPGNEILITIVAADAPKLKEGEEFTGKYKAVMLFNREYLEGKGIDQMYANADEDKVEILTYEGNFAETYSITAGDKITITKIIQPAA